MPSLRDYPTLGAIAERLGEPVHRIRYVIDSRQIRASGRAGNARVFTEADVERIRTELARIGQTKRGDHVQLA